jgi:VWFA-related protein
MMRPDDYGGVFVNGGMYHGRLTTSKTELIAAVRSARPAFENRQGLLAPFREFPRIPGEIDAARIADGARQLTDSLGADACRDDPFQCELEGGRQQVENMIEKKARHYVRQARVLTANTIQNLQYVNDRLSRIPGRKTLVLLSEGFFVEDSRATLRTVAAQAARGGTTIYSIDGRGLIHGSGGTPDVLQTGMTRATTFDTGEDGPTILTAGTGGLRVRNIDDITRAFGMIVRDTSTYYVIGYQPANATLDGKFRKIDVKTRVAGAHVRARKGYAATALPPPASRK